MSSRRGNLIPILAALSLTASGVQAQGVAPAPPNTPPPPAQAWADLAKLPDFGGVWVPDIPDQNAQITTNPTPWNAVAGKKIDAMMAEEKAGNPYGVFIDCLPEAMPSWMMISHNAMEILFTPGRVTLLGESDGNRLRRIHTDGRPHPEDPDLTFHGHSIGHWEGDTLVVDTVGVLPQSWIAISEAAGVRNNGDMHVVERFHLASPDILHVDMEITAPHVLTQTWKTTRKFKRVRGPDYDIIEGVCIQGFFDDVVDKNGDHVFVPVPHDNGNPVPPQ